MPIASHYLSLTLDKAPAGEPRVECESHNQPIQFVAAFADFEQAGFPGCCNRSIRMTASGWAVGGQVERPHHLTLIPEQPISFSGPATLKLETGA